MKYLPHTDNVISFLPAAQFAIGLARYPLVEHWSAARALFPAMLWLVTSAFVLYWLRADHSMRGEKSRPWLSTLAIFPLLQIPTLAIYLVATRPASRRLAAVALLLAFCVGCFLSYAGGAALGRRFA